MKHILYILIAVILAAPAFAQPRQLKGKPVKKGVGAITSTTVVLPGAHQTAEFLPLLKGKRVGVFANHTSTIGKVHLVDSLQKLGITIAKIFGPEHGFRGTADAGEKVGNYTDEQTGIQVISLYGKKRRPSQEDLADVDVLLFDIQDVGVRFYTYISSLQDFMESAIEHKKPLVILDRPNPNGFYVDGPVLDTAFKSYIGMQAVPVVYGLTIGEYAKYLLGERLVGKSVKGNAGANGKNSKDASAKITVIRNKNYTHKSKYVLPVKPSPNLPDEGTVYWYPSTCFFEGTVLSEGRGTDHPFQIFGHPSLPNTLYAFTPTSRDGAKSPKLQDKLCYGWTLVNEPINHSPSNKLELKYLMDAYRLFPDKENFFIKPKKENLRATDYFFNKLAGNAALMQQIKDGKSEAAIRASWQPKLDAFKKIRKKYLLYPDFE